MSKLGSLVAVIALARVAHAQPAFGPPAQPDAPPMQAPAQPDMPERPSGPPPGSTQATFVSSGADGWDVLLDRVPACATPCSIWVAPLQFVSLRIHERNPYRVDVGRLPPQSSVVVTGEPMSNGEYATGITFTALGGMALVTGITLTAVGCSTDQSGMCTAGLITGGVGAAVTAGSIWLIQRSLPRARVVPAISGTSAGVAGTF
jgi:hypothetical protein